MIVKFLLASLLIYLNSCSGIKMLSSSEKAYYSIGFQRKIDAIKLLYGRGNSAEALKQLQSLTNDGLSDDEEVMRRNLVGVVYFGSKKYEQAIFNFNQALVKGGKDKVLRAQVKLNLASSYFQLKLNEKAFEITESTDFSWLKPKEQLKYHKIRFRLAKEQNREDVAINALIWSLISKKNISDIRLNPNYELLKSYLQKVDQKTKYQIFEEFESQKPFVIGYLAYLEAEKVYYKGEKGEAKDLIDWIEAKFSDYPELIKLTQLFTQKADNHSKINPLTIGVVLPLTGKFSRYGKPALFGIDAALRDLQRKNKIYSKLNIVVKDSKGSGVVGANKVKELIDKESVALIIGGLFSKEATKEYEEAKKSGALFISLSQVYKDKEEKNHLLLEMAGSIESQVKQLLTSDILEKFGRTGAIIYPDNERGEAYLSEFWRKSKQLGIEVSGIFPYDRNSKDFRSSVQNLLSLKYPKTRREELKILEEIYTLEGKRSARRIQTLKPRIDFDWVFIPSFPQEAVQIIPAFSYYDAFNVPLIGGPSWRTKGISNESYKYKHLYFVGNHITNTTDKLSSSFLNTYGKRLNFKELSSYDSLIIASELIVGNTFSTREELDFYIRSKNKINGNTGYWDLEEGIWVKNMSNLHIQNGSIVKIGATEEPAHNLENE